MAIIRNSILAALAATAVAGFVALPVSAESGVGPQARVLAPLQAGRFDVGSKKALAYYESEKNLCKVTVILAQPYSDSSDYSQAVNPAVRFHTNVSSGTSTRIETAEGPALALWCAPAAATLFVQSVDRVAYVAPAK